MTDQQLLNEYARQGSEHAFETLVQRHVHLVFATAARHLGGAGPAEEVTQNVFIALARKATQLRDHVALAGWLHQATLQEARRWWRGELRRQRREHTAAELGTTMNEAPSLLATLTGLLDEGLLELREMDRQALMLRYCENLSQREVAARLGVKEDAARKRIGKALERLTRFFQRRGYAVGSAATTVSVLRAAAQMAPAGLAATAARAALSAGAVAKTGGLTMLLGKLMALTKTQTAALSLLVAAGPVISQWHAARAQGAERRRLTSELTALRQEINRRERSLARVGRQLRYSQADVAALAAGGPAGTEDAGRGPGETQYLWDEQSGYVRVPKRLLSQLILSEAGMQPRGKAKPARVQRPVLAPDGTPSPVLLDALDLTEAERTGATEAVRGVYGEFERLAARQSVITNPGGAAGGGPLSVTLVTPPFPQAGAEWRQRLGQELAAVMGPERAGIFQQQSANALGDALNDFGQDQSEVTVTRTADGCLGIAETYYEPDGSTRARSGAGLWRPVPDALQPLVAGWPNAAGPPDLSSPK